METLAGSPVPDDPKALAAMVAELLERIRAMGPAPITPVPWTRFAAELEAAYGTEAHARLTWVALRQVANVVAGLIGPGGTTADITADLVVRFVRSRPPGLAASTINGQLARLRTLAGHAVRRRYLAANPFDSGKFFLRPAPPRRRHHSIEDTRRLLALARHDIGRKAPGSSAEWRARRTYAMLALAAYTGMRRNEILWLRVDDISIAGRTIAIVPRAGNRLKTSKSAAVIPMLDDLAAVLHEWLPHLEARTWNDPREPWGRPRFNPEGIKDPGWLLPNCARTAPWRGGKPGYRPIDRLRRLGERLRLETPVTFQSFRHGFATHAESAWGLSPLVIQRILRHSTQRTQEHYRAADLDNLKAAVRGVGFGGPSDA